MPNALEILLAQLIRLCAVDIADLLSTCEREEKCEAQQQSFDSK